MLSYFIDDDRYLEIYELMQEFTDMSFCEVQMYESVLGRDKEKEPLWNKNQSVMVNVSNLVIRLLKECKSIIERVLGYIKNTVDYVFLKKEDKERYAEYEAYIKSHPQYKDKKITVKDWKKIERKYDTALAEADRLAQDVASGKVSQRQMQKREKTLMDDLADVGTTCMSVLTVDVALRIAKTSSENAKQVRAILEHDQQLINQMEQDLGKKEVDKFRKKVDKMCHETYFTKLRAQILGRKQKDLNDAINDVIDEIAKIPTGGKGTIGNIVEAGKYAVRNRGVITKGAKVMVTDKETRDSAKRLYRTGADIKQTVDQFRPSKQP